MKIKMTGKNVLHSFVVSAVVLSSTAFANELKAPPQRVLMAPQSTFIPGGFDDNDNSQVVIAGKLKNTCYKAAPAKVQVDHSSKTVFVENSAYKYSGCFCAQVEVPYTHTLDLGVLPRGQYNIVTTEGDRMRSQGVLNIGLSLSSSPDDHLYAPVSDLHFEPRLGSDRSTVTLRGRFTSDCMRIVEDRVTYRPDSKIVELLPIVEVSEGPHCQSVSVPFEHEIQVRTPWAGSTLLYVRSLSGQVSQSSR
jgi:hypothetical protein